MPMGDKTLEIVVGEGAIAQRLINETNLFIYLELLNKASICSYHIAYTEPELSVNEWRWHNLIPVTTSACPVPKEKCPGLGSQTD
jgi:hypothetical protein